MHPLERREYWALAGLAVLLVPLYFVLPFFAPGMYASPDETASAVTIRQLDWYGRVSIPEPLATGFPWIHPRSYVSQGETIVPVGFLGWPWIISVFSLILGQGVVPILASLAAISVLVPLYGLLRPFGRVSAFAGSVVGMSYPTMILFGNRALFPQIGLLVLGLWSMFLISRLRSDDSPWKFVALGFLSALALAARPTEIFWVLPWFIWMGRDLRPDRRRIVAACTGALIPLLILGFHAQMEYGGFWKSGYTVHDNGSIEMFSLPSAPADPTRSVLFPFGIHPKAVVWNVWSFLGKMLWPWTAVMLVAGVVMMRDEHFTHLASRSTHRQRWKRNIVPILVAWTVAWLIAYYGQGLYTDHVQRGAVTIANSFVRYLLPLGAVTALCWAYVTARLAPRATRLVIAMTLLLFGYGVYVALARDNEGLLTTRGELIRYVEIRKQTAGHFGPTDLILSERSDKIFFPQHRAALPPATEEIARLAKAHPEINIGLFARPLSQSQSDAWRKSGFEPTELFVSGREKLYLLQPIRR